MYVLYVVAHSCCSGVCVFVSKFQIKATYLGLYVRIIENNKFSLSGLYNVRQEVFNLTDCFIFVISFHVFCVYDCTVFE